MTRKNKLYSTASIKGLFRCFVSLLEYNEEMDMYLAKGPFGSPRWIKRDDLENFVL